jgi:hypothetical protein
VPHVPNELVRSAQTLAFLLSAVVRAVVAHDNYRPLRQGRTERPPIKRSSL